MTGGNQSFLANRTRYHATSRKEVLVKPAPALTWHLHHGHFPNGHDPVILEIQHMRGRVLYADGRRPNFRSADGGLGDPCPLDPLCQHVFVRVNSQIVGCCRLLTPTPVVKTGIETELGAELYDQVLKEVGVSREEVGEAGRWIVAPEYAGLSLGLRIIGALWAVARTTAIPIYIAMAGTRSAQAAALIRTGARPLTTLGRILSQKYDDELQLLFFETDKPASRFKPLIEKMHDALALER